MTDLYAVELPHDLEMERVAIGTMLRGTEYARAHAEDLRPEDFFDPGHAAVFSLLAGLVSDDREFDLAIAARYVEDSGVGELIEGPASKWLLRAYSDAADAFAHAEHAQHLRGFTGRRTAIMAARELTADAGSISKDTGDMAERLRSAADDLDRVSFAKVHTMADLLETALDAIENPDAAPRRINSGIMSIDEIAGGLPVGYPTVIAARTSVGKTGMMTDIIRHVCGVERRPTYVLSCEVHPVQLTTRMLAAEARVDHFVFDRPDAVLLDDGDRDAIREAAKRMADWPIVIDNAPGATILDARAGIRRAEREWGARCALAAIDYAQVLSVPERIARRNSSTEDMRWTSGETRRLARELDIPVILLSQLNRDNAKANRRPRLSDIKQSGAIEQDAGTVILLHRSEDPVEREAEGSVVIVAKNKGPLGERTNHAWCPQITSWCHEPHEATVYSHTSPQFID